MKYKPGEAVWIKGIVGRDCDNAGWVEVFINSDRHSVYIENKKDIRRSSQPKKVAGKGRKAK